MATTILPFTDYNFSLETFDDKPVYNYDGTGDDEFTSFYTLANDFTIRTSMDADSSGNPVYPYITLMFNNEVINVTSDLEGQLEPEISDQSVYINVKYGELIELKVIDRVIERYEVEWLDNNIMMVNMDG